MEKVNQEIDEKENMQKTNVEENCQELEIIENEQKPVSEKRKGKKHKKLIISLSAVIACLALIAGGMFFLYRAEIKIENKIAANNKRIDSYNSKIKGYKDLNDKYLYEIATYKQQADYYSSLADADSAMADAAAIGYDYGGSTMGDFAVIYYSAAADAQKSKQTASQYRAQAQENESKIKENERTIKKFENKVNEVKNTNKKLEEKKSKWWYSWTKILKGNKKQQK